MVVECAHQSTPCPSRRIPNHVRFDSTSSEAKVLGRAPGPCTADRAQSASFGSLIERNEYRGRRKMAFSSREFGRENERGGDARSAEPNSELNVKERRASLRGPLSPDARSAPKESRILENVFPTKRPRAVGV